MRIPTKESEKGIVTKCCSKEAFMFHSYETIPYYLVDFYKERWYIEMTFSEFKQKYPYPTKSNKRRFREETKEYKTYYKNGIW